MDYSHLICSVCLDSLKDSVVTPCGHPFHLNCMKEFTNHQCPICNSDIKNFLASKNIFIKKESVNPSEDSDDDEQDDGQSEDDEESEDDNNIENIKQSVEYKSFYMLIDHFFDLCDGNNILCRENYTCCNTCGYSDIYEEAKDYEDDETGQYYDGFIFFHQQEADRIITQISKNESVISVLLNWGLFNDSASKEDYDNFAKKLVDLANQFTKGCTDFPDFDLQIIYDQEKNINSKLEMRIKNYPIINQHDYSSQLQAQIKNLLNENRKNFKLEI